MRVQNSLIFFGKEAEKTERHFDQVKMTLLDKVYELTNGGKVKETISTNILHFKFTDIGFLEDHISSKRYQISFTETIRIA